jgi:hypothetical protein
MSKVKLSEKQRQEKKLDLMESGLKTLLHQIENNFTSYNPKDVEKLRTAVTALNQVTLLSDTELNTIYNYSLNS